MAIGISRTTEPLRFDVGIGRAGYADVIEAPYSGEAQKALMPGTTTVSQAVDALFPKDASVSGEIMAALVAANPAALRTSSGFGEAARAAVRTLRGRKTAASQHAADEIEKLLADTDLVEHCRMALLET
jgi:hypothetical protein